MKKLLLTITGMLTFSLGFSQYHYHKFATEGKNPGGLNNDAELPEGSMGAGWTKIDAGGAASARWSATQTIPFTFNFNGNAVTEYKVSTSGVLTFETAAASAPAYLNGVLPGISIPDKSVCIWGLSGIGSNDFIFTKVFGVAGSRQLWIHFNSYGYGTTASDNTNFTYWSIVLEEGTDNIYIVDQRTGGYTSTKNVSAGIQIDGTTATSVLTSPALVSLAGTDATPADNVFYQFVQGVQPVNDLAANSLPLANFLILGSSPYDLSVVVRNMGSAPVTNVELSYTIDGGTAVTDNVTGLSIAPGASATVTHPMKWNAGAVGTYTIEIWASLVNGVADEKTANDKVSKTVQVVDQFIQRKALHEMFSSSSCAPCKPGNEAMHAVIDAKSESKYTVIKYQQNFPGNGDPYFTTEALNRRNYYAINSIPRLELDGGFNANPTTYSSARFDEAADIPAFLDITATHSVHYHSVAVDVSLNPLQNFNGDLRLHVAILEKQTFSNIATNGETKFEHVMKKMLPNEGGTAIGNLTKGTPYTKSFSYDFKGAYRLPPNALSPINHNTEHSVEEFTDLEVIVFVQNHTTKEVFQSTYSTGTFLGVKKNDNPLVASTKVYPNPAASTAKLDVLLNESMDLNLTVLDQMGREVLALHEGVVESGLHTFTIDVSSLAAGTYFIKINTNDQITTEKIVIVK